MPRRLQHGVTLIEMMLVVALIALMAGLVFPTMSSGIDTLRLSSATSAVVSFLNGALNRAERRQEVVEIEIALADSRLRLRSTHPGFQRELRLPEGVTIRRVLPEPPYDAPRSRRFLVYPGGTAPRIAVELENGQGRRRLVRVDPVTGVPQVEEAEEKE